MTAPLNGIVGPGTTFEGDLSFEGRVRVDGTFRGRIYSEDMLELGPEGVIEGQADVARARLSGRFVGDLRVREHLWLESTARLEGHLDAGRVEMKPGACVQGEVRISGQETP